MHKKIDSIRDKSDHRIEMHRKKDAERDNQIIEYKCIRGLMQIEMDYSPECIRRLIVKRNQEIKLKKG